MTTIQTMPDYKRHSLWQLFFGIIDQPLSTFQAIVAQPRWYVWVAPLLLLFLSQVVLLVVQTPHTLLLTQEQMEGQLAAMPESQAEEVRAGVGMAMSLPFMLATGIGLGTLALIMAMLAQATFLYFAALVSGGELTFGVMFRMSVWSHFPMAIGALVQAGFMAATQRSIQYPGLAFLVNTGNLMQDMGNPLFALLGGIDLFWLWHLLLVVLGLSVAARFGRGKSLVLTLIYAALSLTIAVLPTLLFGGMMGGR